MTLVDLSGRVALVTGGSRGIGAACAVMLAEAGAAVAITYRNRVDDANDVVARVNQHTKGCAIRADMGTADDCRRAVDETVGMLGRLDFLVANAGVWPPEDVPVSTMSDDRWLTTMQVNLHGVFWITRAALQAVTPGGRIVIISSTASQRGEGFHADYAASKGALNAFVKSVAVEAAPHVTVNAVAPGWVDTEMCAETFAEDEGAVRTQIEGTIPMGRVAAARDIAGPVVFLCSGLAAHITGEIVNVNGGSVLCG